MGFYHQPNSFIHKLPIPNQIMSDTMESFLKEYNMPVELKSTIMMWKLMSFILRAKLA